VLRSELLFSVVHARSPSREKAEEHAMMLILRLISIACVCCTVLDTNSSTSLTASSMNSFMNNEIVPETPSPVRLIGTEVATSGWFAYLTLAVAGFLLIKGYFDSIYDIASGYPRAIATAYLIGALAFSFLCTLLAVAVEPSDGITITSASMLYAGVTMGIGPAFVFTPVKPIKLKKETFFKKIAAAARKKSSRFVVFFVFVVLTMLQGIVAYDLYALLGSFNLDSTPQALTVFGYCIVAVFYLLVFYSSVLGRSFVYNDIDMV
jgi:hypothetical protein